MSIAAEKDWNQHVLHAEEVARGEGFVSLRDRILQLAEPQPGHRALDVGAGTGLLTLPLAERVQQVWAIDIAPSMCEYLRMKAASAGLDNLHTGVASADSLPLVDECVELVVSNYCLHHLDEHGKRAAVAEAYRVLTPGGRFVFGDMMFSLGLSAGRDREVVRAKVRAMLHKGPAGVMRLMKNGARIATGRWEQPARAEWWREALGDAGFTGVQIEELHHEGGIAVAHKA